MLSSLALLTLLIQKTPNYRVLLVGINDYPKSAAIPSLKQAVNDANQFKLCLSQICKVPESSITVLNSPDTTTLKGIRDSIKKHLIDPARPGDVIVFGFFGHGASLTDITRPTGQVQGIVPSDVNRFAVSDPSKGQVKNRIDPSTMLLGPELGRIFDDVCAKVQKDGIANVTLIFDCCNSGGITRGQLRSRGVEEDLEPAPSPIFPVQDAAGYQSDLIKTSGSKGLVVLSAADPQGKAYEDGEGGRFTSALIGALSDSLPNPTKSGYKSLFDKIQNRMTRYPAPKQTPQLGLGSASNDRELFSTVTASGVNQMLLTSIPARSNNLETLILNRGAAAGLQAGDIVKITTRKSGAIVFARVEQRNLRPMTCEVVLVQNDISKSIKEELNGAPVVIHERSHGRKFQIFNPAIAANQKLSSQIQSGSALFEFTSSADTADFALDPPDVENGNQWTIYDGEFGEPTQQVRANQNETDVSLAILLNRLILSEIQKKIIQRLRPKLSSPITLEMSLVPVAMTYPAGFSQNGVPNFGSIESLLTSPQKVSEFESRVSKLTGVKNIQVPPSFSTSTVVDGYTWFAVKVKASGLPGQRIGLALLHTTSGFQTSRSKPFAAGLFWPLVTQADNRILADGREWFLGRDGTMLPPDATPSSIAAFSFEADEDGVGVACLKLVALHDAFNPANEFFTILSDSARAGATTQKPSTMLGKAIDLSQISKELNTPYTSPASGEQGEWSTSTLFLRIQSTPKSQPR